MGTSTVFSKAEVSVTSSVVNATQLTQFLPLCIHTTVDDVLLTKGATGHRRLTARHWSQQTSHHN